MCFFLFFFFFFVFFFFFFFWSEQVTRAESSNPVPPLKSSGKRAAQPDKHHPVRRSSAITSPHGHTGDAFGATCREQDSGPSQCTCITIGASFKPAPHSHAIRRRSIKWADAVNNTRIHTHSHTDTHTLPLLRPMKRASTLTNTPVSSHPLTPTPSRRRSMERADTVPNTCMLTHRHTHLHACVRPAESRPSHTSARQKHIR